MFRGAGVLPEPGVSFNLFPAGVRRYAQLGLNVARMLLETFDITRGVSGSEASGKHAGKQPGKKNNLLTFIWK